MARKGGAVQAEPNGDTALPNSVGTVRRPLEKPESVGTLTVPETQEIKERRRLIEEMAKAIVDKQKVLGLLRNEHTKFLQGLLSDRGLSLNDDYNVDSDSGLIYRTAKYVAPESVSIEETEPVVIDPKD